MSSSSKRRRVAVIIPVYNPPPHWEVSCLEHIVAVQALLPQYRFSFTFVNDGSDSNIFRKLRRGLRSAKTQHSLYSFRTNQGKGKALRTGVQRSPRNSEFFICADWDFPFGVKAVEDILEKLEDGYVVVTAHRGEEYLKKLPMIRALITRSVRRFIKNVLNLNLGDTQAGVKGFHVSVVPHFLSCQIDSFLHDLEFILNCKKQGVKKMTSVKVHIRGGVKLTDFALPVYLRELKMLISLIRQGHADIHLFGSRRP